MEAAGFERFSVSGDSGPVGGGRGGPGRLGRPELTFRQPRRARVLPRAVGTATGLPGQQSAMPAVRVLGRGRRGDRQGRRRATARRRAGPCFQQYEPLPGHRRPGHRPRLTGFESCGVVLTSHYTHTHPLVTGSRSVAPGTQWRRGPLSLVPGVCLARSSGEVCAHATRSVRPAARVRPSPQARCWRVLSVRPWGSVGSDAAWSRAAFRAESATQRIREGPAASAKWTGSAA
jgi:hypothetical protein